MATQQEGMHGVLAVGLRERVPHGTPEEDSSRNQTIDEVGSLLWCGVVMIEEPPEDLVSSKDNVFEQERTHAPVTTEDWVDPCLDEHFDEVQTLEEYC